MMRPRDYGAEAARLLMYHGKDEAVQYLQENCPKRWRRLAYTHAVNQVRLARSRTERETSNA